MMKSLVTVTIALICALWIVAIAILSIQNVFIVDAEGESTLVSLTFLGQSSIRMSFGVVLALSVAIGMITTGLLLPAFISRKRTSRR